MSRPTDRALVLLCILTSRGPMSVQRIALETGLPYPRTYLALARLKWRRRVTVNGNRSGWSLLGAAAEWTLYGLLTGSREP